MDARELAVVGVIREDGGEVYFGDWFVFLERRSWRVVSWLGSWVVSDGGWWWSARGSLDARWSLGSPGRVGSGRAVCW